MWLSGLKLDPWKAREVMEVPTKELPGFPPETNHPPQTTTESAVPGGSALAVG